MRRTPAALRPSGFVTPSVNFWFIATFTPTSKTYRQSSFGWNVHHTNTASNAITAPCLSISSQSGHMLTFQKRQNRKWCGSSEKQNRKERVHFFEAFFGG
jgi:hypothetical protein